MDALISLVYTIIDSVCVCLFLDAFASHRWRDHRFLVGVIVQTILMYASIEFSVIALNRNQIVKIFLILLSCFIVLKDFDIVHIDKIAFLNTKETEWLDFFG